MFKIAVLSLIALAPFLASANSDGVSADKIKIGMSIAMTGPLAADGNMRREGVKVYLEKLNAAGGVNGRKIELLEADDGYEPANTVANTRNFIEKEKVFALFHYLGTPTVKACLPLINAAKIPLIAPITGGNFIRQPIIPEIINLYAGYNEEGDELVKLAVEKLGTQEIGIVSQDDALGAAGTAAVHKALADRGLKIKAEATYKRNTVEVDDAVKAMKAAKPKAIIVWGTFKPTAAFIKKAVAEGVNAKFLVPSSTTSTEFVKEVGKEGEGTYLVSPLPYWEDSSFPVIRSYLADMKAAGKQNLINTHTMTGYMMASLLHEGLKKAGKDPTRQGLIAAYQSMTSFDLGGLKLSFSPTNHQGMSKIFPMQISGGKIVPLN